MESSSTVVVCTFVDVLAVSSNTNNVVSKLLDEESTGSNVMFTSPPVAGVKVYHSEAGHDMLKV